MSNRDRDADAELAQMDAAIARGIGERVTVAGSKPARVGEVVHYIAGEGDDCEAAIVVGVRRPENAHLCVLHDTDGADFPMVTHHRSRHAVRANEDAEWPADSWHYPSEHWPESGPAIRSEEGITPEELRRLIPVGTRAPEERNDFAPGGSMEQPDPRSSEEMGPEELALSGATAGEVDNYRFRVSLQVRALTFVADVTIVQSGEAKARALVFDMFSEHYSGRLRVDRIQPFVPDVLNREPDMNWTPPSGAEGKPAEGLGPFCFEAGKLVEHHCEVPSVHRLHYAIHPSCCAPTKVQCDTFDRLREALATGEPSQDMNPTYRDGTAIPPDDITGNPEDNIEARLGEPSIVDKLRLDRGDLRVALRDLLAVTERLPHSHGFHCGPANEPCALTTAQANASGVLHRLQGEPT